MPNTRDIKRRITSVDNTRQITRAMEMVAATKMRQAQAAVLASRDYAARAAALLARVAGSGLPPGQPLLAARPLRRLGIVLVTSDRGLAGPLNTNVVRSAVEAAQVTAEVGFVTVGRKGEQALHARRQPLLASFGNLPDTPHYDDIRPVAKVVIDDFTAGKLDRVLLVFPKFMSMLRNQPQVSTLLPAEPVTEQPESTGLSALTLFEPSEEAVLDKLLPRLVEIQLYQALLETRAAEHSSRMLAMRNASQNAGELLGELRFSYNQARQAAITTEIAEIASGAEAQAGR